MFVLGICALQMLRNDIYDSIYDFIQAVFSFSITAVLFVNFLQDKERTRTFSRDVFFGLVFGSLAGSEILLLLDSINASCIYLNNRGGDLQVVGDLVNARYDLVTAFNLCFSGVIGTCVMTSILCSLSD